MQKSTGLSGGISTPSNSTGALAETRGTATVRAVDDVELFGLSWRIFQETLERSDRADRDFAAIAKDRIAVTS